MYAVKNDKGKWLGWEIYSDEPDWFQQGGFMWESHSVAENNANKYGGQVIELGAKPTPEVVSEEEAKMLENALWPATAIANFSAGKPVNTDMNALEYRLMRAYVIGWVVAKPKQYLVKVKGRFERPTYYALRFNEYLAFGYREQDQQKLSDYPAYPFTDAEIIKYGLENCEKVEVSNKGEKDE